MSDDSLHRVQRDWLGHGIQLAAMFVVIGLPALVWGIGANATITTMAARIERQDRDVNEARAFQQQTTLQMLDINRQLATIAAQISSIRENTRTHR